MSGSAPPRREHAPHNSWRVAAAAALERTVAAGRQLARRLGPVGLVMLGSALTLKRFYGRASADDLEFVLAPSCRLAQWLGGLEFAREHGAGFISHTPRMVVGVACAGVNFIIAAGLALYFSSQARWPGSGDKLRWLGASWIGAYAAGILTNAVRIALAAQLYAAHWQLGLLTAARLHLLLGVGLYCSALLALCGSAPRAMPGRQRSRAASGLRPLTAAASGLQPLVWYLGVALGLPLANGALSADPQRFVQHAAWTAGAGVGVVALWWALGRARHRVCSTANPKLRGVQR